MNVVTRWEEFVAGTRMKFRTKQGTKTVSYEDWVSCIEENKKRREEHRRLKQ